MNSTKKVLKIQTRDFGEQEIFEEDIIYFPNGLFAFEDCKRFVLFSPLGDEASPMWLQCVDSIKPCFIVFKPMDFISDYNPNPNSEDLEIIKLEKEEEIEYLSIAVVPNDYKNTTLNIKSPIIINRNKKLALQTVLQEDFDLRFPLYKEIKGA